MKKTYFIVMIAAAAIIMSSCEKKPEALKKDTVMQAKTYTEQTAPPFTYYVFGKDITEDDLLKNPDDPAEEKFNHVDYALSLGLLEIYNHHADILSNLITKMRSTTNKCYNLLDFANQYPSVNPIYDSVFAARFSDFAAYGSNWKTYVQANYKYDTTYIPFVTFANRGTIDFDLAPYVAAPFEINEEKFTGFDDNLPMWVSPDSEDSTITTVNEAQAYIIQNPILLCTNAFVGFETTNFRVVEPYQPPAQAMSCGYTNPPAPHVHEEISHTKFKINYRYERTGKSEYTFAYASSRTYVLGTNSWAPYPGDVVYKTMKVKKSQIGDLLDFSFDVFYPNYYRYPFCIDIAQLTISSVYDGWFAVAAYEADWYAGFKDIFTIISPTTGQPEKWQGRRKFDNEWYFFDPATNDSYPFMTRNPTPNSEYVNYNKGELHLLRHY